MRTQVASTTPAAAAAIISPLPRPLVYFSRPTRRHPRLRPILVLQLTTPEERTVD